MKLKSLPYWVQWIIGTAIMTGLRIYGWYMNIMFWIKRKDK